jgi:hypothetical protein
MATKARAVKTVDEVDGVSPSAVGIADLDARAAVEQYEQQAWAMRPTEHAAVRAVLALLWLIALELRALRKERAG